MIKLVSEESGVSEAKSSGQPFTKVVRNAIGGAKDEDRLGPTSARSGKARPTQTAAGSDLGNRNQIVVQVFH